MIESTKQDIAPGLIEDIIPERLIRVYPYELVNAGKSEAFVQENTVSIASISQNNLDATDEILKLDDSGYRYFEMFAAITSEGKLDISSSTSVFGQELKEEDGFTALSNWYYEGELKDIQIGSMRFLPAVFSIGIPFDKDKYENGEQALFIPTSMVEAKEGNAQFSLDEINTEGLYEFTLVNLTAIESSFINSRVIFTENIQFNKNTITVPDTVNGIPHPSENGITLKFENHTLLHSIKGKGKSSEFIAGVEEVSEFGDIEFISKEPLAPFKMTPISTQDKVTMFADWFDYDTVMPFVFAEKFRVSGSLSDVITNEDDRHMVEDMLVISDGFANSWADAPRDITGDNAGKIKPDFRIGWSGIKVQAIEGKDPVKTIDGIYETHIRKYPAFNQTPTRYQPVREILNALSRYIYSSYAIGKGQNSFNEAYLPWVLHPTDSTPITTEKVQVLNPDYGASDQVESYVLVSTVKFMVLSTYFRDKFSDDIDIGKDGSLILPSSVNLSNVKLLQTDRKLTLPELPDTVSGIAKLPLPGDINTTSSQDLSYIFYLPIQDQDKFEDFMLNSLQEHTTIPVGQDVSVQIPNGVDGKVWTLQEATAQVLRQQPGQIKQNPGISNVESTTIITSTIQSRVVGAPGNVLVQGHQLRNLTEIPNVPVDETTLKQSIANALNYEDADTIVIKSNTIEYHPPGTGSVVGYTGQVKFTVTHSEFTTALVTITSSNGSRTFSFQGRETLFDKEQWQSFISDFGIVPTGSVTYNLLHKKDQQHNTEFKINELDEIIISSMWGNYVDIKTWTGPNDSIRVPLFNEDDESIGVQRIIFT